MRARTDTLPFPDEDRPSLLESRDDPAPSALTEPEREDIYARLQQHNALLFQLESRIDSLQQQLSARNDSIPVTISGPRGFSIVGSWRVAVFIAVLAAAVYLTTLVLPYIKPLGNQ